MGKVFQHVKQPAALVEALRRPRYELIPLAGARDSVLAHVPRDVALTVTASPTRGLDHTLDAAEELAREGYTVVPHVSARLVRGGAHLDEVLARLAEAGMEEIFVVAGDAEQPAGPYDGAHALLVAIAGRTPRPQRVGITGYPESHPFISDDETIAAMFAKAPYADYIVSQITFDADVIASWIRRVRARGTHLPIYLGVPGRVDARKLLRISMRVGVGDSAKYLRRHAGRLTRLALPGAFSPDRLLERLAPTIADETANVAGLHVYTFNELAQTERWRREVLARLAPRTDD